MTQGILEKHGILFAQVVNSLILKVKNISTFAMKISKLFLKLEKSVESVLCNSHTSRKLAQGQNLPLDREKTWKTQGFLKCNLSGYSVN